MPTESWAAVGLIRKPWAVAAAVPLEKPGVSARDATGPAVARANEVRLITPRAAASRVIGPRSTPALVVTAVLIDSPPCRRFVTEGAHSYRVVCRRSRQGGGEG